MLFGAFWFFVVILFFGALVLKANMPPPLKSGAFRCFLVLFRDWYRLRWVSKRHKAPKSTTLRAFWCFLVVSMRLRGRQSCSSPPIQYPCFLVLFRDWYRLLWKTKHQKARLFVLFGDSSLLVALTPPGVYNLVVCLEVTLRHCPERFH